MSTIADDAEALLALAETIEKGKMMCGNLSKFPDEFFENLLAVVGNLHDPVIDPVKTSVSYLHGLLEDFDNGLEDMRKIVRRKGLALKRIGRTSY